jgi:hypothetical protein
MKRLRGTIFMLGGICWILAALVCASFVVQYVAQGAGLQFWPFGISSGSVLIGLVHVVGFVSASGVCFAVGVGLCAHGLVPPSAIQKLDARSATDGSKEFTVKFGEIGRSIEYDDLDGAMRFTFSVSSADERSLSFVHPVDVVADSRYQIAFDRTKQHLESLGFSVDRITV